MIDQKTVYKIKISRETSQTNNKTLHKQPVIFLIFNKEIHFENSIKQKENRKPTAWLKPCIPCLCVPSVFRFLFLSTLHSPFNVHDSGAYSKNSTLCKQRCSSVHSHTCPFMRNSHNICRLGIHTSHQHLEISAENSIPTKIIREPFHHETRGPATPRPLCALLAPLALGSNQAVELTISN